jgi:hypothetical protein
MGGIDLQLEDILAEGERFVQCESSEMLRKRKRSRVTILPIRDLIPDIDARVQLLSLSVTTEDNIFRLVSTSHIQCTILWIAWTPSHGCHGYLSSLGCASPTRPKLDREAIDQWSQTHRHLLSTVQLSYEPIGYGLCFTNSFYLHSPLLSCSRSMSCNIRISKATSFFLTILFVPYIYGLFLRLIFF